MTSPTGTAVAGVASILGLLLSIAAFIEPTAGLLLIGLPTLAWGSYQLLFIRRRSKVVRIAGGVGTALAILIVAFLATERIVEPSTTEFVYGGELLTSPDSSPLSSEPYPILTDDPADGTKVETLIEPTELVVSCWLAGQYNGQPLYWASIVDGDYRNLWVPLVSLGAMARGAVRDVLPCSDWRWRIQHLP